MARPRCPSGPSLACASPAPEIGEHGGVTNPPDEPTRWIPPAQPGDEPTRAIPDRGVRPADEPTRVIPVGPVASGPAVASGAGAGVPPYGGPPYGGPPAGGGLPPGEPSNPNRTLAGVAIGLVVVLLLLVGLLLATRHKSKSATTTTTTTTASTEVATTVAPTTTLAPTTTKAPTTTVVPTTVAPTTIAPTTTQAAPTGNRPPTSAEQDKILADVGDSHPGYQVTTLRIANSDNTWAVLKYAGAPTQQPFSEVRHLSGGSWKVVSTGTAQVACDPSIPVRVQQDFANVLGSC